MKNFCLIGASGYIAERHMKAIFETNNNLSIAFDINDSIGKIDKYFPNSEFFTNYLEFKDFSKNLQNEMRNKLDYFSVCSPNHMHFKHIVLGLELGCNVICEKPLVTSTNMLNKLEKIEAKTEQKVYTILQLRHHKAIQKLKYEIDKSKDDSLFDVELTYITSRGKWYDKSWKSNPKKGFGLVTNIGIHFFDMLHFLFGNLVNCQVHLLERKRASGYLEFEKSRVKWFLSIDEQDLPKQILGNSKTFREIKIDGKTFNFSKGFDDLHTISYENILRDEGFGIQDTKNCINTVEKIRKSIVRTNMNSYTHPYAKNYYAS